MFKPIVLIGVGGAIGSILRYLITESVESRFVPSPFPYGTLVVNVAGCFAIGLIDALSDRFNIAPEWRAFLATGICGGFTTFSSFSYQGITLIRDGHSIEFLVYMFGSLFLGLLAAVIPVIAIQELT